MTAKEYLQQARTLDLLINAKQDELYALRQLSEQGTRKRQRTVRDNVC